MSSQVDDQSLRIQAQMRLVFDPNGILNPGKAIPRLITN